MASPLIQFNPEAERKSIIEFVRNTVKASGASGTVVGLSGGIDSAVTGALCVEALGRSRVLAVLMKAAHTPTEDVADAEALVREWGVESAEVETEGVVGEFLKETGVVGDRLPRANLLARVRMVILYYFANSRNLLVAGTGDRSEIELGYFTKFGDGGADFLPIAHLYKTQVRALGEHLGLPERVVKKPASPQLWAGQKATDELPADYDVIDPLLYLLFEKKVTPERAADESGLGKKMVERILRMHDATDHKRRLPPSLRPRP